MLMRMATGGLLVASLVIGRPIEVAATAPATTQAVADEQKKEKLSMAAWHGDLALVRRLVAEGAGVNANADYTYVTQAWETALSVAVGQGHIEIAEFLLANGAKVNDLADDRADLLNALGASPLEKRHRLMTDLLKAGARTDAVNYNGRTMMQELAAQGDGAGVDLLVARGVSLDPFSVAMLGRDEVLAAMLKEKPELVKARGPAGATLLHVVASEAGTEVLLDAGADVHARDDRGGQPLHAVTAQWPWTKESPKVFELLIARGADIQSVDSAGRSVLTMALEHFDVGTCKRLLKAGAQISGGGIKLMPFENAVTTGDVELVRMFLDLGAKASAKNPHYGDVLHSAMYSGNDDIVKLLVERGAEVDLTAAAYMGRRDQVEAMLKKNPLLIEQNVPAGGTALYWAAAGGRVEIVKYLIGRGASLNELGREGMAIHIAAQRGHVEVVRALLDAKSPADVRNRYGKMPLDIARTFGREEIVKMLIAHNHATSHPSR